MSRVSSVWPWALTAAAIAAVVCLVGWPHPTLCVAGLITGAIVLLVGLRLLAAEQRQTGRLPCSGCVGCGGPDCAERPDGSGSDPETARTDPDDPEAQPADQAGHEPDDLRTRIADAIRHALKTRTLPAITDYAGRPIPGSAIGLTEYDLADIALTVLRPERCCSCGSNDVVYHNFREQPFCSPCADGDRPAMHRAAVQQIRAAAGRLLYPVGARVLAALDEPQLAPPTSTRSNTMPTTDNFQDRGDAARRAAGIDGTAGDAQDIRHRYAEDPAGGCLLCGLAPGHRKHIDRPLDCGFCFEEDGEEIHPHPECPRNSPVTGVMQSPPQPPTPRCPECDHPMGDHSVHTPPRPTWCHACNTTCGHTAAAAKGA